MAAMARVIAAMVIVAVNIVVVAPSIATMLALAPKHQPTPTTAAHRARKVQVAQLALSRVMTQHVKAVETHAAVVATVATRVTADKTALTPRKQSIPQRVFRQAAQRKHRVSRKARVLKLPAQHKPMINVIYKTAQKVSRALTTTTIVVIQSANVAVVVAVVANVVKTKVQALRTKMAQQACNKPSLTPNQAVA